MSPSSVRPVHVSFLSLFLVTALDAQQPIPLSPGSNGQIQTLVSDPNPEPEWDIVSMDVANVGQSMLVRNDTANDPERLSQLLVLNKTLFEEILCDEYGILQTTTGDLGTLLAAGAIGGVEIDIFDQQYDTTPDPVLGVDALLEWVELTSGGNHVGYMYLYDAALYDARIAAMGAVRTTVWLGDMIHTSSGAGRSVNVLGNDNVFQGSVRSSGGTRIGGFAQDFGAGVFWSKGLLDLTPGAATFAEVPLKESAVPLRSAPEALSWYQSQPNTLSFAVDVRLQDDGGNLVISDGSQSFPAEGKIVYTTGSIEVEGFGLAGTVTLVADGAIHFTGSSCLLSPASTDVLAWATGTGGGDLWVEGSGNVLNGSLFAPLDVTRIPGSSNTITGQISSKKFKVTGGFNVLSDGAH